MKKRQELVLKFFNHASELSVKNKDYRLMIKELFSWLIKNDGTENDLTTKSLFSQKNTKTISARIITREEITVAGIEEIAYLLKTFTKIKFEITTRDGLKLSRGSEIIKLFGNPSEILTNERMILNILQRMCGIATETAKNVSLVSSFKLKNPPFLAATRKTTLSLLDKKAVALGGGITHRLKLSDGILVKDNHLLILGELFNLKSEKEKALKALDLTVKSVRNKLIEIEVEDPSSINILIEAYLKLKTTNSLGILLDNFSPKTAAATIKSLQKYDLENIVFEASGGINSSNLKNWCLTGVDLISLGSLTHSIRASDLSLEIINK